jgi:dihydropteroate synthase
MGSEGRLAPLFPMLVCGRFTLSLDRPLIMGILNVTPNSFFDGGKLPTSQQAVEHALYLIEQGADMLDVGGESTRPGAAPVSIEEELRRVMPVLEALQSSDVPVSIDTRKPQVMRVAIQFGAAMINDVCALQEEGAVDAVADSNVAVCLMHMQGEPQSMQTKPSYMDVVGEVTAFLAQRIAAAEARGISRERLIIDPGFGFGKALEHNLALLRHLDRLATLGVPVLAGLSRKSMLGQITGRGVSERVHASVAAAVLAAQKGAKILRVHDVAATRDALSVIEAVGGN